MTFSGWVCVDVDGSTWGAISDTPEAALASGLRAVEEVFGPVEDRSEEDQEGIDEFSRSAQAVRVTVECATPEAARAALRWLTDGLDEGWLGETLADLEPPDAG